MGTATSELRATQGQLLKTHNKTFIISTFPVYLLGILVCKKYKLYC